MKTDSKQQGNVWVILAVVIALLIVLAGGYYYYTQQQAAQQAAEEQAMMEEQKALEEKALMEKEKMMMREAEDKLALLQAKAEAIRLSLSEEAEEALDIILEFVESDPTVLLADDITSYPPEIQDAIDIVLSEAEEGVAVNIEASEVTEDLIGQTATLQGVLAYEDDQDPLGPYFSIVDETLQETFYFLPGDALEQYEELNGEVVTFTVEITGVEDGNVLYEVTNGPTAVAESDAMDSEDAMEADASPAPQVTSVPTTPTEPTVAPTGSPVE